VRINPGSSITAVVSFDVPDGATGADTVELYDSACMTRPCPPA
jgi:hypothetical protein